jgi:hypothetical protein
MYWQTDGQTNIYSDLRTCRWKDGRRTAKNRVRHKNAYRHVDKSTNGLTDRLKYRNTER